MQLRRAAADRAVNIVRLNAYDLTDQALERHYIQLVRHHPTHLVGYTSAVFQLARFIQRNELSMESCHLKAVIVTSETASGTDIATMRTSSEPELPLSTGLPKRV